MFQKLRERFDPRQIRTRRQGGQDLQYVDIATTIERFLDVVGEKWEWHVTQSSVVPVGEGYLATVTGRISVEGVQRMGVGADYAKDPDKAYKTALAEAFKKAGHYFGVGLELWDEDVRGSNLRVIRGMGTSDVEAMKVAVMELALIGGAEATAQGIADYFGVTPDALKEPAVLTEILNRDKEPASV